MATHLHRGSRAPSGAPLSVYVGASMAKSVCDQSPYYVGSGSVAKQPLMRG